MRLGREEVIDIASRWARDRYPVVPPVASVMGLSDEAIDELERRAGERFSSEERQRCANRWLVAFFCSWDTDSLGMPHTLLVHVDDATGRAELYTPEDE